MKREFAFALVILMTLAACNRPAPTPIEPEEFTIPPVSADGFDVSEYVPENATEVDFTELEMNGDQSPEKAVFYVSDDVIYNEDNKIQQHLELLTKEAGEWVKVFEQVLPITNTSDVWVLRDRLVVDLDQDGRNELFVRWAPENAVYNYGQYKVWAYKDEGFAELLAPSLDAFQAENYGVMQLAWLQIIPGGLRENYKIPCGEAQPIYSLEEPIEFCGDVTYDVLYQDGQLLRQY